MHDAELLPLFIAKRAEIGAAKLAQILDISASGVRMICTGNHPNPVHVLNKFAVQFVDPACTFTAEPISRDDCDSHANGARPFGGPTKQQWWDACQSCPFKNKRKKG